MASNRGPERTERPLVPRFVLPVLTVAIGMLAIAAGLMLQQGSAGASGGPVSIKQAEFAASPSPASATAGQCVAPVGLQYRDRYLKSFDGRPAEQLVALDPDEETGPATITYVNEGLPPHAWSTFQQAMRAWEPSPCVHLQVAIECPEENNCVHVSLVDLDHAHGGAEHAGGAFDVDRNTDDNRSSGGEMVFDRSIIDDARSTYLVAVHEIGHSLGLDHRSDGSSSVMSVMNHHRGMPDRIDFDNLLVLYGQP